MSPLPIFGLWRPQLVFRILSPLEVLNFTLKYFLVAFREEVDFSSSNETLCFSGEASDFSFDGETEVGGLRICTSLAFLDWVLNLFLLRSFIQGDHVIHPSRGRRGGTMPKLSIITFRTLSTTPLGRWHFRVSL